MNAYKTLLKQAGLDSEEGKKLNISNTLAIAANLKAIHVKTKSYAAHMALDAAFASLNDTIDMFNECVQGYYLKKDGKRLDLSNTEITLLLPEDDKIMEAVQTLEDDFRSAADSLVADVSALESLRDDVLNGFYQLYYRLDLK